MVVTPEIPEHLLERVLNFLREIPSGIQKPWVFAEHSTKRSVICYPDQTLEVSGIQITGVSSWSLLANHPKAKEFLYNLLVVQEWEVPDKCLKICYEIFEDLDFQSTIIDNGPLYISGDMDRYYSKSGDLQYRFTDSRGFGEFGIGHRVGDGALYRKERDTSKWGNALYPVPVFGKLHVALDVLEDMAARFNLRVNTLQKLRKQAKGVEGYMSWVRAFSRSEEFFPFIPPSEESKIKGLLRKAIKAPASVDLSKPLNRKALEAAGIQITSHREGTFTLHLPSGLDVDTQDVLLPTAQNDREEYHNSMVRGAVLKAASEYLGMLLPKSRQKGGYESNAEDLRICGYCFRYIHSKSGVIAHHGYRRFGDGQQTDSCFGARKAPFESSPAVTQARMRDLTMLLLSIQIRESKLRSGEITQIRKKRQKYEGRKKIAYWETYTPEDKEWAKLYQAELEDIHRRIQYLLGPMFGGLPWFRAVLREWVSQEGPGEIPVPEVLPEDQIENVGEYLGHSAISPEAILKALELIDRVG